MNKNSVTVLVFKYNMSALLGIVFLAGCALFFLLFLLFNAPNYLWLFLPIAFFAIYVRYGNSVPYKAKLMETSELTLSTEGIKYGEDFYPAKDIETAAMYLYAFENFEYRDGFVSASNTGFSYVKAPGDKNKLSFRTQGKVLDFDFYLDDFAHFCAVRRVLNDWATEGINVVLKQAFDDDFIIQEMEYYKTPSGL